MTIIDNNNKRLGTIIMATANFLSVLAVTPFMDRINRTSLLLWSCIGMILASCAIIICLIGIDHWSNDFSWLAIISVALYTMFFEIGLGPIPWLYVSEISPIKYRARINSIAQVVFYSILFYI